MQTIRDDGEPDMKNGPLAGVRVIEIAGIGPGPCAGMMLADLGNVVILGGPVQVSGSSNDLQQHRHAKDLFKRVKKSIGRFDQSAARCDGNRERA
jgi:crotonobetainyl-CoA:carnitine CoA-transferase CaiB-like acyl-CoA transferase